MKNTLAKRLKHAFEVFCYAAVSHIKGLLSQGQFLNFQERLCFTLTWSEMGAADVFWSSIYHKSIPSDNAPTVREGTETQVFPCKYSTAGLGIIL